MLSNRKRYFNRDIKNKHKHKLNKNKKLMKPPKSKIDVVSHLQKLLNETAITGSGPPNELPEKLNINNGNFYVDQNNGNAYLYISKLGWIDLSSWQPDIGEGMPAEDNPPSPLSGDQYLDILTGDFYIFIEGLGWVLQSGVEGPQGPPGESFSFDLVTSMGPTGPVISGPIKVTPGRTIQLWMEGNLLHCDVI